MTLLKSNKELKKGEKAPSFELKGTDGRTHSLSDFKETPALIIFMCNHCPYVKPKIEVIKNLQAKFQDELVVIGINSNESENYPEDSFENMQRIHDEKELNFLYLRDKTQEVAKRYGAVCTPDPFLFDENHELVYHGRLNDAMNPGETAEEEDMKEAVEKMLSGEEVEEWFKPSMGCSIKWKK